MEQSDSDSPDPQLRSVRAQTTPHSSSLLSPLSTPRIANSEPSPEPSHVEELSDSILNLRFPKPAGNRQLSNWISSSSPDIMQPGSITDTDLSLSELGYDVIGTDGESQAESVASSFDYQQSDGIQSLAGTDVDTDSSDDEDSNLHETTTSDTTVVHVEDRALAAQRETEREAAAAMDRSLEMVERSLENPTNLSLAGFSPFTSVTLPDLSGKHEPFAVEDTSLVATDALTEPMSMETAQQFVSHSPKASPKAERLPKTARDAFRLVQPALTVMVLLMLPMLANYLMGSMLMVPKELATVPVASVPVVVSSSSTSTTSFAATPTTAISGTPDALQTSSSRNGLGLFPFGKDDTQTELTVATTPSPAPVCSVERVGRDEILVRIPQRVKNSWLFNDALLIAVSRELHDVPTKVSSVDDGFLIRVPLSEAYGALDVTIATSHKPRVNKSFRVHFAMAGFTDALDAGKQLVRGFAQRVVDTVNGTTSWVEDTYIPAMDVVSKHVSSQTASMSQSVLHGLQEATDNLFAIPNQIVAQIRRSLDMKTALRRMSQLQLELTQEMNNVHEELRVAVLKSRLSSRLLWLKLRGKAEEHGQYSSKAELFLKEQRGRFESARAERAERTKQRIRAWRERDRPVAPKGSSFWSRMEALAGFGAN
ncbi:hypothetical protein F4808DRAFT_197891 [Astrocystis sublimbata]|nr:hypothetical protein F4808DRAFT_197891 [Astrocystis sublimbata]